MYARLACKSTEFGMSSVPAFSSSNLAAWRHAFRLRTLPLAAACILLGSGLAGLQGGGSWRIGLLALLTTFLLQILANLANDYGDTLHGADGPLRIGPPRAMQQGWIQPQAMRRAIALCGLLAALSGAALLLLAWPAMADWGVRMKMFFHDLSANPKHIKELALNRRLLSEIEPGGYVFGWHSYGKDTEEQYTTLLSTYGLRMEGVGKRDALSSSPWALRRWRPCPCRRNFHPRPPCPCRCRSAG